VNAAHTVNPANTGSAAPDAAASILADLQTEQEVLAGLLARLTDDQWSVPTAAADWDVRDQIAHIALVDRFARMSVMDPDAFAAVVAEAAGDPTSFAAALAEQGRAMTPAELLELWQRERLAAIAGIRQLQPGTRLPWFGPSMSPLSFATARLMETWSHGHDVFDAVDVEHPAGDGLRHIAELGYRTRGWSYSVRGLAAPSVPVALRLWSPSGASWTWGAADADETIDGDAVDFCLVVTQRRHWEDTSLVVQGVAAQEWMEIAQAFAGPPTVAVRGRGVKGRTATK
jgi:uncharacterized protein (TIGR03084 family)